MKRIAIVTHELSGGGGVATMAGFLYRTLKDGGRYEPHVFSLAMSSCDRLSVLLRKPGGWLRGVRDEARMWRDVPYTHIGSFLGEVEFMRYQPRAVLDRTLRGFDLVQVVCGSAVWAYPVARVKLPFVVWAATTLRSDRASQLSVRGGFKNAWSRAMVNWSAKLETTALRRAQAVLALTDYTYHALSCSVTDRSRLDVAPCGVDTTLFTPVAPGSGGGYIMTAGRLSDPRKNIPCLIHAYCRLVRTLPDAPELWLVGGGNPDEVMKLCFELNLGHKVRFLGRKEPSELAQLYRRAMLFVLSSDEEGLGIVLLEAMASGLPVICTKCGGPETVVVDGRTGILVPVRDPDTMADAMITLTRRPDLRRSMARAARERATEAFSMEVTGEKFQRKYDEILGFGNPCC